MSFSAPTTVPTLPTPAGVPGTAELQALLTEAQAVQPAPADAPGVVPLAEDWTTQGDWLGRYGRYFMCGCAMFSQPGSAATWRVIGPAPCPSRESARMT